jgi:hypothetical protein
MTEIFPSLPQGSKDYLTGPIVMAIGIIFYFLGQIGLAMMFFSVGIVLFMFFFIHLFISYVEGERR